MMCEVNRLSVWMKSVQHEAEHKLRVIESKIVWGFYETLYVS
jgi:hypothetical protein